MVNYANGKVYMIRPRVGHEEGEVYIGSTTKHYLSDRIFNHRQMYKQYKAGKRCSRYSVFDLFDKYGCDNCDIILVEEVNANSKAELFSREAHYIRITKCVNKLIPILTREEVLQSKKDYKIINKDKVKEYNEARKEKVNCECGGVLGLHSKHRHMKSNKHLSFLGQADMCITINVNCPCGGHYSPIYKYTHEKTQRHLSHINNTAIETKPSLTNCPCGGHYQPINKHRHETSKLHLSYINKTLIEKKPNVTNCPCGGHYKSNTKYIHSKTKQHLEYVGLKERNETATTL